MTLDEYRIRHSKLIELYQLIEYDLEDLYAILSEEPFCQVIREIEKDSIGGVVRQIRKLEEQKNIKVFSESQCRELDVTRERRNFWCHACYTDHCDSAGVPDNARLLTAELDTAKATLQWLRQIKRAHMDADRKPRCQ